MKNLLNISNDQIGTRKSITDYTPFELSQIERFQNANRGFSDNEESDLENDFDNVYDVED